MEHKFYAESRALAHFKKVNPHLANDPYFKKGTSLTMQAFVAGSAEHAEFARELLSQAKKLVHEISYSPAVVDSEGKSRLPLSCRSKATVVFSLLMQISDL